MNLRKFLITVMCAFCFTSTVWSDDLIKQGGRVRIRSSTELGENGTAVTLNQDQWITGDLLQKDAQVLTLQTKEDAPMKFPVNSLLQVQVSHGKARKKGLLIGAAVGAGAGLIYGAIDTANCNSKGGWFCGLAYSVTVLTTPAGALIGYVAAPERWADIPLNEVQGKMSSASRSFQLVFQW